MEITYMVVIALITYILGAITKIFVDVIPDKYIPIQNVVIGIISGIVCYCFDIETNLFYALVICLLSTMSAGGFYDLTTIRKKAVK